MKIILLSLALFINTNIYCQSNTQDPPVPLLCPALEAFNGEWLYENTATSETIRVYLKYHEFIFTGTVLPERRGVLIGWHKYSKNNVVIESTYETRFASLPDNIYDIPLNDYSILISATGCDLSRQKLLGTITDKLQANELKTVTINFNQAINIINWKQRHSEGYGTFTGAFGMTLPKEFILIKQ